MKESTSRAGVSTRPQLDDSSYYRWVEPNSNITVCLNLGTMDRLQIEVLGAIETTPGKEVGGILIGRTEPDLDRTLIYVDDFEPVACPRRDGTVFTLNREDEARFAATLLRVRSRRAGSVVGYYRSHNRSGLFLSPDDLRLIQRHFPEPDNLFLLVKTLRSRACTAGFFFWKDGRIQAEFTDSEAPLIPVALSAAVPSPAAPGPHPVEERIETAPPPAVALPSRRRLAPILVLTGIAAAATLGVMSYRAPRPLPAARPEPPPQLAAAIAAPAPPAIPPASIANPPKPLPAAPARPQPSRPAPPVAADPNAPPPPKPFTAPPLVAQNTALNALTISSTEPAIIPPSVTPPAVTPLAPPRNLVAPAIEAPPRPAPPPSSPPASAPPSVFVGPQVIHRVAPAVPRGVGPLITTDVQLDVEVAIDTEGKVTAARVVSTKGSVAGFLTLETLKAARLFRFRPAQQDGRNVAGAMTLTFRFEGTAK